MGLIALDLVSTDMENKVKFRIGGVPEHFNLPWHLGIENGIFESHGVSVSYQDYPGGTGAMTRALEAQELDIAIVLTEGMISAIHKGNPAKIIKSYIDTPLIWGIHVAANGNIHTEEEIQDKTFAISRLGSGSHLMPIVDAMHRGWEYEGLKFATVKNLSGAVEALPKGEADVFLWERFSTQPHVDSGAFRRVGEVPTPWPSFMIAVHEDVYAQSPEKIRALLHAINESANQLMKDEAAVSLIASRYKLAPSEVKTWFGLTTWSTDLSIPTQALLQTQKVLIQAGIVEKALPLSKLCFV